MIDRDGDTAIPQFGDQFDCLEWIMMRKTIGVVAEIHGNSVCESVLAKSQVAMIRRLIKKAGTIRQATIKAYAGVVGETR